MGLNGFYNGTFDQDSLPKHVFTQTFNKPQEKVIDAPENLEQYMISLQPPDTPHDALTTVIDNTQRIN